MFLVLQLLSLSPELRLLWRERSGCAFVQQHFPRSTHYTRVLLDFCPMMNNANTYARSHGAKNYNANNISESVGSIFPRRSRAIQVEPGRSKESRREVEKKHRIVCVTLYR